MAKPRLEKVEALFYVLKQVAKGGCIRILIHPLTEPIRALGEKRRVREVMGERSEG